MLGFALVALTLGIGAWVLFPVIRGTRTEWEISEEDTPLGRLSLRKEVLLGNLQDLDFEFAMGKLAEHDYRSMRESLKRQTMKIMEQMDVVQSSPTRPDSKATPAANACGACGGALPKEAHFCPVCGEKVVA